MINIECLSDIRSLNDLSAEWDALSGNNFMRSFAWQSAWLETKGSETIPRVLVARREGTIVGLLPLVETYRAWTGRTLLLIGSGKVCSDDIGILCQPENADEVAKAFSNWLLEGRLAWEHIDLDGIRAENETMLCFANELELQGSQWDRQPSLNCWALPLPGTAEGKIPWTKKFRQMANRFQRELDAGEFEVEYANSFSQSMAFLDEIERLHQSRWKVSGIDGCFSAPKFREFINLAMHRLWGATPLGESGSVPESVHDQPSENVQISILRLENQIAAGLVAVRYGESYAAYLSGMAVEFNEHRPGLKLHWHNVLRANSSGCRLYDFLRGDEVYKHRMGASPAMQERWLICSPRWSAKVRSSLYHTAKGIRDLWKKQVTALGSNAQSSNEDVPVECETT